MVSDLHRARTALSAAETSAALSPENPSFYQPSTRPRFLKPSTKKPRFMKRGLGALFVTIIIGIFILASSAFSLLGFHIQELFTKATNIQNTSRTLRLQTLGTHLLKNQGTKHTTLPKKFKSRLKQQGIEYGFIGNDGKFTAGDAPTGTPHVLKYKDEIITDFSTKTAKNPLFVDANNRASRSNIAGFFDSSAEHHYRRQNLTRNDFADYRQTGDSAVDDKNFKQILGQRLGSDSEVRVGTAEDTKTTDENGNETTRRTASETNSRQTAGADATTKAKSYLDNISRKSQTGTYACTALKVGNLISAAINALESFHSISFFMNITENISKTKAGIGHQSAIHSVMDFFNRPATTTVTDTATGAATTLAGTPLESTGMRSILHNLAPNRSAAKNFSLERSNHLMKTSPALQSQSLKTCSTNQAVGAVISLASLVAPGGALVKASVALLKTTVMNIGIQIAISGALAVLVPTIAEAMFTSRVENAVGKAGGELFTKGSFAAGSKLARSGSGFSPADATSAVAFSATTSAVNRTSALASQTAHPTHPLDLTTTSSFLGQILFNFNSALRTANTPLTTASTIRHNFLSSLLPSTLADQNSSYSSTFGDCPTLESIGAKGDIYCNPITTSDLNTIDLAPDDQTYKSIIDRNLDYSAVNQNPPSTAESTNTNTNTNTNTTSPAQPSTRQPKPTIKPNSPLANYILYCTERDSPFGTIDANILNSMQTSLGVVGDNLPVLNDIIDIINAAEDTKNLPWGTGSICVNSANNPRWNSEFKYYQRYIEDERILSQLSDSATDNPVLAFKAAHELAHPTDHSPAGTIARLTGLTKYDAEGLLALAAHHDFLSSYHPRRHHQFSPLTQPKIPLPQPSIISHFSSFVNIFRLRPAIFPQKPSFSSKTIGITA